MPERFERVYNMWLSNIRDWCVSRQLWWGHRIPVWCAPLSLPTPVEPYLNLPGVLILRSKGLIAKFSSAQLTVFM